MKQRLAKAAMHGKPARAAYTLLAAGMIFSGCEPSQGGQSDNARRPPPIAESDHPGAQPTGPAVSPSNAPGGTQTADAAAAQSAENKGRETKPPQTIHDQLLSAATSKVWEIRERINATAEQDLRVTVTLTVGPGGRPVSVIGATASTRGGATRDVSDLLGLDTTGLSMPSSGAKHQATESVIIRGE